MRKYVALVNDPCGVDPKQNLGRKILNSMAMLRESRLVAAGLGSSRQRRRRRAIPRSRLILKDIDEFQLSNSNRRRVTDFAPLGAFGGPRDVNSTTKIKESSKRSMNFNSRIRIVVA